MSGKQERVILRYCERGIGLKSTDLCYLAGRLENIGAIGGRYTNAIREARKGVPEASVEGKIDDDGYRPVINISGSAENVKKALNIIFDRVGIPPETEIGLRDLTGIGTSRKGYKLAKEVIKERGHKVKVFLRNFSKHPFGSGYAPIVKKKQFESKI